MTTPTELLDALRWEADRSVTRAKAILMRFKADLNENQDDPLWAFSTKVIEAGAQLKVWGYVLRAVDEKRSSNTPDEEILAEIEKKALDESIRGVRVTSQGGSDMGRIVEKHYAGAWGDVANSSCLPKAWKK